MEPVRIFWTGTGTGKVIFSGPVPVPAEVIFFRTGTGSSYFFRTGTGTGVDRSRPAWTGSDRRGPVQTGMARY